MLEFYDCGLVFVRLGINQYVVLAVEDIGGVCGFDRSVMWTVWWFV